MNRLEVGHVDCGLVADPPTGTAHEQTERLVSSMNDFRDNVLDSCVDENTIKYRLHICVYSVFIVLSEGIIKRRVVVHMSAITCQLRRDEIA